MSTNKDPGYQRACSAGYERASPAIKVTFSREAIAGGAGCLELYKWIQTQVPARTSSFHKFIEKEAGSMGMLFVRFGFVGSSGLYLRPGALWPDILVAERLAWSLQPFLGAVWSIDVTTDVGPARIFVADMISLILAKEFEGDVKAMLDAHTKD